MTTTPRTRPATRGKRTVYTEVGVWQEGTAIHVTVLDSTGGHFAYRPTDKEHAAYKQILQSQGRWTTNSL